MLSFTGHIGLAFTKLGLPAFLSWVDTIVTKVAGTWDRAMGT